MPNAKSAPAVCVVPVTRTYFLFCLFEYNICAGKPFLDAPCPACCMCNLLYLLLYDNVLV
uniref:Uncharacterized protein n=1 Tax=Arundo donax TaxID=35708 RepID=A0A0A9ENH1_ARUDO